MTDQDPSPVLQEQPQDQSSTRSSQTVAVQIYLTLYNFVSAILWLVVLGRVVLIALLYGANGGAVYSGTGQFVKWTQTLAVLEIGHAVFGLVRTPLLTTGMQVASRLLLVWAIVNTFPLATSRSPAYASMLTAWSATEVIRYSFFAINLSTSQVPDTLKWLRYNTFFVLYPLGISSECWLVYSSIVPAERWHPVFGWALKAVLLIYIPGSYILFTHMMAQRRKVMKGKSAEKTQ